jgi:hypothetical protein
MGVKSILQQGGDGTAIPAGMVGEVKIAELSGASATTLADTEIDVGSASITLSAGAWEIGYTATTLITRPSGSTEGAVGGRLRITDSSNNVISGTEGFVTNQTAPTGTTLTSVGQIRQATFINITEQKTYKLRMTCRAATANGSFNVISGDVTPGITGNDTYSYIYAKRIA